MTDPQPFAPEELRSIDDLRRSVHETLCRKENLLAEQFPLAELPLTKRGRPCGLTFSLRGPRDLRLGAVWASEMNVIYLLDAHGERYETVRLARRLGDADGAARAGVA